MQTLITQNKLNHGKAQNYATRLVTSLGVASTSHRSISLLKK